MANSLRDEGERFAFTASCSRERGPPIAIDPIGMALPSLRACQNPVSPRGEILNSSGRKGAPGQLHRRHGFGTARGRGPRIGAERRSVRPGVISLVRRCSIRRFSYGYLVTT